jgi:hypothetical protein
LAFSANTIFKSKIRYLWNVRRAAHTAKHGVFSRSMFQNWVNIGKSTLAAKRLPKGEGGVRKGEENPIPMRAALRLADG